MYAIGNASIWPNFVTLTDPRQKGKIDHLLQDIVMMSICAVISGSNTWPDIYEYGVA